LCPVAAGEFQQPRPDAFVRNHATVADGPLGFVHGPTQGVEFLGITIDGSR